MPTIKEIYDQEPLKILDGWDIAEALFRIAQENASGSGVWFCDPCEKYSGTKITGERKVDVNYDYERGAITDVLLFDGAPFAVVSRAGRGCDDTEASYVTNSVIAEKAIMEMVDFKVDQVCSDVDVELEYWEGTPVELGQSGWL